VGVMERKTRQFLTDNEVASLLNVRVGTVRKWRLFGKGPPWRKFGGLPGAVRYRIDDLEEWIRSQPGGGEVGTNANVVQAADER